MILFLGTDLCSFACICGLIAFVCCLVNGFIVGGFGYWLVWIWDWFAGLFRFVILIGV